MKKIVTLIFSILFISANAQQHADTVTNKTIIALYGAHLSSETIKAKIEGSTCDFDLTTIGLITLKKANIPDDVIAVMLHKNAPASESRVALAPGIYYKDPTTNNYVEMEPTVMTAIKGGGMGEAMKRRLVSGLFNAKLRASIDGATSPTKASTQPIFVFVFDTTQKRFSANAYAEAQSPKDIFLVELTVSKNSREIVIGKENNVSKSVGVSDGSKIGFQYKKERKGMYTITLDKPLEAGEYGFMFSSSSENAASSKIYDFSVK